MGLASGKKLENAYTEEEKRSHLPCAGIILFRFYGYYLSQIDPRLRREMLQHPGNFRKPVFRRQYKDM
jgi:hypothetical protein